jgi:hypothetical protein
VLNAKYLYGVIVKARLLTEVTPLLMLSVCVSVSVIKISLYKYNRYISNILHEVLSV